MNPRVLVATARHRAGLSQRDLARRAGVPQSTIARIESSVIDPRFGTVRNLLQACGYRLALRRMGEGIDRTMMRELIKLPADELMYLAEADAAGLNDFLSSVER